MKHSLILNPEQAVQVCVRAPETVFTTYTTNRKFFNDAGNHVDVAKIRAFLREPQGAAQWKKGNVYAFRISISASEIPQGIAEITFDESIFVLVDSVKQVPLSSGSYQKEITWYLKPITTTKETAVSAFVVGQAVSAIITVIA